MPHKHRRGRNSEQDKSAFDLPPNTRAKPLPVHSSQAPILSLKKANAKPKRPENAADDTPKQFLRLMRWSNEGKKLPKGLDDGNGNERPKKKRKRSGDDEDDTTTQKIAQEPAVAAPKILPGERLADFAARVDQALPLSNLASLKNTKSGKPLDPKLAAAMKERPTKHNKRLLKMQKDWREEEARRKAKREEEAEDEEEREEREGNLWGGAGAVGKESKKKKRRTGLQGPDDDPWAELSAKKREATRQRNLQDVVLAPPTLDHRMAVGKGRIFRDVVVNVENVPGAVGSLRKREEIAAKRREVIELYRQKRGGKWENRIFEGGE